MIAFDAGETARFFNEVYRRVDLERGNRPETRLHPRDRIFLGRILPSFRPAACRILDYGCGQGRLLAELLARGFDARGVEKHDGMRAIAEAETANWSGDGSRVTAGGIEALGETIAQSCDVVIAMGVFQYLPKTEYDRTLAAIRRLLKPGGALVATYQNAFFDLFTFNKYSVDFLMEKLVLPMLDAPDSAAAIADDIRALLTNPERPTYAPTRARDNIFVHLTNPLTLEAHLKTAGFVLQQTYFYEFFGLPPLLAVRHEAVAKAIAERFEIENATAWQGHFMANALLAHAVRA
jgi:SAM-dependent methyltransferase